MTTKAFYAPTLENSAPSVTGGAVAAFVGKALALWAQHRRAQRDYERLLEMSERELTDMGLTRGEVLRAQSEPLRLFGR